MVLAQNRRWPIGAAVLCWMAGLSVTNWAHAAPAQVTVVASGGPMMAAQGNGVLGDLALRYPLGHRWGVQIAGRSGWLQAQTPCLGAAPNQNCASQGQLALLVGPTWTTALGERTLHASVLLAHVHHTATANWQASPVANAAGDSSGDVQHRSGAEFQIGLSSAPWSVSDRWALALELELNAGILPSSQVFAWSGGAQLGLAVTRRPEQ